MEEQGKGKPVVVAYRRHWLVNRRKGQPLSSRAKKLRAISLALLLVIVVGGLATWYFGQEKPVLIIGDKKIYQEEYDMLVDQARKVRVNEEGAQNTIIDGYRYEQTARQIGITFSREDLAELEAQTTFRTTVKDEMYYLGITKTYIDAQLKIREQDGHEGYVYYYPFSRNFLDSDPDTKNPLFNDEAAIERDRKVAEEKANDGRNRLIEGKVKPGDLIKEVLNDESLIYGNASNGTQHFIVDMQGIEFTGNANAGKDITRRFPGLLDTLKDGTASPMRMDTQKYLEVQSNKIMQRDAAYYFVYKVKSIVGDKDIAARFKQASESIKVVNNAKN